MSNIAVFVPSRRHFGNVMTQIPFLTCLKKVYPDAKVSVWTKVENSKHFASLGVVDEFVNYKSFNLFQIVSHLNKKNYTHIYNLYSGSEKVHLAMALCKTKQTFGHSDKNYHRYFYDKHFKITKGLQYIANSHLSLLNNVHGTCYTPETISSLTDCSCAQLDELTLLPCGGAGEFKKWDIRNYLDLADKLTKTSAAIKSVNIILGPDESELKNDIPLEINGKPIKIYVCPNVPELISIAKRSCLSVSNDCGPGHVFQMVGTPVITVWGWSNERNSPYKTMQEWFYSHENSWTVTPPETNKTINAISVDKVYHLANAQLSKTC
jgi:ADP-heptose:LPS heptosyltransferase